MRNDAFIHPQGVLNGPYYHFGFLRLIVGLYLLTPVLRVILAHAKRSLLKYSLLLWLAGTTIAPAITILAGYNVTGNVFLITGWLGYFVLGAYIVGIHWSSAQPSTSDAQHLGTEQQATVAI
jgi:surface polysaccharide O-acyltransferase-like enzyme